MNFALVICLTLFFTTYATAQESQKNIVARSIAEHCQFIYQIKTEFKLAIKDPQVTAVRVWLEDLYTHAYLEPWTFTTKIEDEIALAAIDLNTMSTNPKYLAHEMFFTLVKHEQDPVEPKFKTNFSKLMNRCYDRAHRDDAPFLPLEIQSIN